MQNQASSRRWILNLSISAMLILVMGLWASVSYAEYRVYQYYVKSRIHNPKDADAYQVISTLDPISYKAYHGGGEAIKVDMIRTWTCPGHTGNRKPICPAPDDLSSDIDNEALNWNHDGD